MGGHMGQPARQLDIVTSPAAAGALMDPIRLRLLSELAEPGSASSLSRSSGQPRQRINYHLHELERAGLVELVEERKKGNCVERVVRATARAYVVCPTVLGAMSPDPATFADRTSSAYLIAVSGQTIREVAELRDRAQRAGKQLPTLTVQTEVRFNSASAMNSFAEEATAMLATLVAKYHAGDGDDNGRLFKFTLGGHPAITKPEELSQGVSS